MLNINKKQNGREMVIELDGRLDALTSPMLESELSGCLNDVGKLIFDMEKMRYISSAGLRVLLFGQKLMADNNGSMTLIHVCPEVEEVFDVTGFSSVLNIE